MRLVEVTVTATTLVEFEDDYDTNDVDKFVRDNYKDLISPLGDFKIIEWKTEEVV